MLGLFRRKSVVDPELGELRRSRGHWRGMISLSGSTVPLAVGGPRSRPDAEALAAARSLPSTWAASTDAVAHALLDHLEPYRDAVTAGEVQSPRKPLPAGPVELWASINIVSASVTSSGGQLVSEVALTATWDEEHTMGIRFARGTFVELNASILPV